MVLVRVDRLWEAVGSESVRVYRQIDIVAPRIVSDFPRQMCGAFYLKVRRR